MAESLFQRGWTEESETKKVWKVKPIGDVKAGEDRTEATTSREGRKASRSTKTDEAG
jgi:hypothetical protein